MSANNEARSVNDALDDANEATDGLRARIEERAEQLVDGGKEAIANLGSKVRTQVRDRPLTALVVAGSVGLLLGLLIARKR